MRSTEYCSIYYYHRQHHHHHHQWWWMMWLDLDAHDQLMFHSCGLLCTFITWHCYHVFCIINKVNDGNNNVHNANTRPGLQSRGYTDRLCLKQSIIYLDMDTATSTVSTRCGTAASCHLPHAAAAVASSNHSSASSLRHHHSNSSVFTSSSLLAHQSPVTELQLVLRHDSLIPAGCLLPGKRCVCSLLGFELSWVEPTVQV